MKQPKLYTQKNKLTTEQLCEAWPASAIPHELIIHIFSYFYDVDSIKTKDIDNIKEKTLFITNNIDILYLTKLIKIDFISIKYENG